ncbi:MAG TPA: hypothetical protein VFW23_04770 [Tepidisphaeraceae bacterium]|nr:hypothetical protein [Tepidisphaeraceae bacterium]
MTDMTLDYHVNNENPEPLTVYLEPWAEEVVVAPKSLLLITIFYDRKGALETVMGPKYLTVWVWAGCRIKLALNGKDLTMPSLLRPSP